MCKVCAVYDDDDDDDVQFVTVIDWMIVYVLAKIFRRFFIHINAFGRGSKYIK